jgi:hypothetical protein
MGDTFSHSGMRSPLPRRIGLVAHLGVGSGQIESSFRRQS